MVVVVVVVGACWGRGSMLRVKPEGMQGLPGAQRSRTAICFVEWHPVRLCDTPSCLLLLLLLMTVSLPAFAVVAFVAAACCPSCQLCPRWTLLRVHSTS